MRTLMFLASTALVLLTGCSNGPPQASAQQVRAAGAEGRCIGECDENQQAACYAHTDKKYGVDTKVGQSCAVAFAQAAAAAQPDCNTPTESALGCHEISLSQYLAQTGQSLTTGSVTSSLTDTAPGGKTDGKIDTASSLSIGTLGSKTATSPPGGKTSTLPVETIMPTGDPDDSATDD